MGRSVDTSESSEACVRRDPAGPPPPLVWPKGLSIPSKPPALVYLDLNHWIGLAKARGAHRDGARYEHLLDSCQQSRARGAAIFVLADVHYMELAGISDPKQRHNLATLMEDLSGFASLVGRAVVARLELETALDSLQGVEKKDLKPLPLIGSGVGWAFGVLGRFRICDADGKDVEKEARAKMGDAAYDEFIAFAQVSLERQSLDGPQDDEIDELRRHGWAPEKAKEITAMRLDQEVDFATRLDAHGSWRRGRLRDAVCARELEIELKEMLDEELRLRETTLGELVNEERSVIRALVRGMPSSEVSVELKTAYHRNPSKKWLTNDIHDIDAMALAVPYCDVVFTDAAARRVLITAGLDARMHTKIPRRPDELADYLDTLR